MFNITADVKENDQVLKTMQDALKELENTQALVGIPEDDKTRKKGHISNAALLYIHSNGSPQQGIPARPIIEPALEDNKERLGELMGKAVKASMAGDTAGMRRNLELAGKAGRDFSKAWFVNPSNNWKELSKPRRKSKQKKGSGINPETGAEDKSLDKPLIDTGQLRNSITYVLRDRQ